MKSFRKPRIDIKIVNGTCNSPTSFEVKRSKANSGNQASSATAFAFNVFILLVWSQKEHAPVKRIPFQIGVKICKLNKSKLQKVIKSVICMYVVVLEMNRMSL